MPLAIAAGNKTLEFEPEEPELLFRKGILHRLIGDDRTAEDCWNNVLTLKPTETFASYDPGIFGELTRKNLEALRGEHAQKDGVGERC